MKSIQHLDEQLYHIQINNIKEVYNPITKNYEAEIDFVFLDSELSGISKSFNLSPYEIQTFIQGD